MKNTKKGMEGKINQREREKEIKLQNITISKHFKLHEKSHDLQIEEQK